VSIRIEVGLHALRVDERERIRTALRRYLRDNGRAWGTWTITADDIDAALREEWPDDYESRIPAGAYVAEDPA
jgi:hypothetical protein